MSFGVFRLRRVHTCTQDALHVFPPGGGENIIINRDNPCRNKHHERLQTFHRLRLHKLEMQNENSLRENHDNRIYIHIHATTC